MTGTVSFFAGQSVTWSDEAGSYIMGYIMGQYGEGPFVVLEVEEVPTRCTCGLSPRDEEYGRDHQEQCGVNNVKNVGHPQWVFVETKRGRERFSGKLMQPTEVQAGVIEQDPCPECGTIGRSGPSTLGGPGCTRYCYECCAVY